MATQWIDFDATLGKTIQQVTVETALQALRDASRGGGDVVDWRSIVDGRFDADPNTVKPYGKIEFVRRDLGEIVEYVWKELIRRSPVLTGRYQDSHVLMINGVQAQDISAVKPGDRVQFVNTQPYARKIEGGGTVQNPAVKPQSMSAPNGVYRVVYRSAKRLYGKAAFIDFRWKRLNLGVRVMRHSGGGSHKRTLADMIYPVISIRALGQAAGAEE